MEEHCDSLLIILVSNILLTVVTRRHVAAKEIRVLQGFRIQLTASLCLGAVHFVPHPSSILCRFWTLVSVFLASRASTGGILLAASIQDLSRPLLS